MKPCPLTKQQVIDNNENRAPELDPIINQWFCDCGLDDTADFWLMFGCGTVDVDQADTDNLSYPFTPDEAMVLVLMASTQA